MHRSFDLVALVRSWPVESQQRSRRNARHACSSLAQVRAEREDVEDFLASVSGSAPGSAVRTALVDPHRPALARRQVARA